MDSTCLLYPSTQAEAEAVADDSEFQNSQGSTVRLCLKTKNKQAKKNNKNKTYSE